MDGLAGFGRVLVQYQFPFRLFAVGTVSGPVPDPAVWFSEKIAVAGTVNPSGKVADASPSAKLSGFPGLWQSIDMARGPTRSLLPRAALEERARASPARHG